MTHWVYVINLYLIHRLFNKQTASLSLPSEHVVDIDSIDSSPSLSFCPEVPTTTTFFVVEDTVDTVE